MHINNRKYISVCIPTSYMSGKGVEFLKNNFEILSTQTFKDFDIIITDNSRNNDIYNLCSKYKNILDIHYTRNWIDIGMTSNINKAIKKATGKIIKILFLDDFLYSETSLGEIKDNFDLSKDNWFITASEHTRDGLNFYWPFYPKYNHNIHLGENTISSPSVLSIKNTNPLLFDKHLTWLMDCDYYKRCYEKFGLPKVLDKINVVNRVGEHQVSNTIATKAMRGKEYRYILKKFNEKELLKEYDTKINRVYKIKRFLRKFKTIDRLKVVYRRLFS